MRLPRQRRLSLSPSSSRFLAVGAPLLILVGAGFVGLQHLLSGKLEIKVRRIDGAEAVLWNKREKKESMIRMFVSLFFPRRRSNRCLFFFFLLTKKSKTQKKRTRQDAHKRALELGDKARKEFDLEAEAEVRRNVVLLPLRKEKKKKRRRRRTIVDDCCRFSLPFSFSFLFVVVNPSPL